MASQKGRISWAAFLPSSYYRMSIFYNASLMTFSTTKRVYRNQTEMFLIYFHIDLLFVIVQSV